jgi:hypothetical protein
LMFNFLDSKEERCIQGIPEGKRRFGIGGEDGIKWGFYKSEGRGLVWVCFWIGAGGGLL